MNRMAMLLVLAAPLVGGCGDDNGHMAGADMAASSNPAPKLGAQIDRMGRAGVNTALTNPFDTVMGSSTDAVKDAYNAVGDPTMWAPMFKKYIAGNLAIFDGADGTCGNSIGVMGDGDAGGRYDFPATVLVDDELYVNTGSGTCSLYLAVEAAALGVGAAKGDCGGRTPTENTIDETYTLLTGGVSAFLSGSLVTNGITADADNPPGTTFPFLGAPN
jgi:hypothetical protein